MGGDTSAVAPSHPPGSALRNAGCLWSDRRLGPRMRPVRARAGSEGIGKRARSGL